MCGSGGPACVHSATEMGDFSAVPPPGGGPVDFSSILAAAREV